MDTPDDRRSVRRQKATRPTNHDTCTRVTQQRVPSWKYSRVTSNQNHLCSEKLHESEGNLERKKGRKSWGESATGQHPTSRQTNCVPFIFVHECGVLAYENICLKSVPGLYITYSTLAAHTNRLSSSQHGHHSPPEHGVF